MMLSTIWFFGVVGWLLCCMRVCMRRKIIVFTHVYVDINNA